LHYKTSVSETIRKPPLVKAINNIKNIKKNYYMEKKDFQYGGWNSYTLQCGMWLWHRDSEFTKWQHPAM